MPSPPTSALPIPGAVLAPAIASDAAEVVVLQRCCWVGEAIENERERNERRHHLGHRAVDGRSGPGRAGYRDAGPARDPRGNLVPGAIILARPVP